MPPIISVKNLSVTLGGHLILNNLSFTINPGDIVAIIGPNGSGKTTLLKSLLGLIPYHGHIQLGSTNLGYVPQRLDFDRTIPITVTELLSIHLQQKPYSKIDQVLTAIDAKNLSHRPLGVLSGGEFQRVLVALALLNDPDILFLDEPTASVDAEGASELYTIIKNLQRSRQLTIILVSHDIDVVFKYATNVLCVNRRLVCSGSPKQALTQTTLEQLYGEHQTLYPHQEKH